MFRLGGDYLTGWPPVNDSQMALVAVFENGWGPDELTAKLGRVLDPHGQRKQLEGQLVSILASVIQAVQKGK
jgi:hypothetical protein